MLLVSKELKGGDISKRERISRRALQRSQRKTRPKKGIGVVREVILTFMSAG